MLEHWNNTAKTDGIVWLDEVSRACADMPDSSPVIFEITLFNGKKRAFTRFFPRFKGDREETFVRGYLCNSVYNILTALGGNKLAIYYDFADIALGALISDLDDVFQLTLPRRSGFGKAVSEMNRICAHLGLPSFCFERRDYRHYSPDSATEEQKNSTDLISVLRETATKAARGVRCGIDVGGTDIKLALAVNGVLIAVREYDWNPAEYDTADEIIAPILRLTRLMRACAACYLRTGEIDPCIKPALCKDASDALVERVVNEIESDFGKDINVLDSVGLSFPDVVIRDAIVGGETPKTRGLRRNRAVNYETEFAKITHLKDALKLLCRDTGNVRVANDGNIAAYTAAMELAHSPDSAVIAHGVFAHSLGTDLGTGWLDSDGSIPELTLELYDSITDLGSRPSRSMPVEDLRSVCNENSYLASVRRYIGQSGVFRMAYSASPELLDGFIEQTGGVIRLRTYPEDMRKPCLEHIMLEAERGNTAAESVFRQIGCNLAHASIEGAHLLQPETNVRFIFGRFVKHPRCFELICEGFGEVEHNIHLVPADSSLAYTPLMRALAQTEDATVAQFGQAIGAVYYGATESSVG